MSTPSDNGAKRITPEQSLARSVNELFQQYLGTGGTNEFLMGLCDSLKLFIMAPQKLTAERQAQMMLEARSQITKTPSDESPSLPAR